MLANPTCQQQAHQPEGTTSPQILRQTGTPAPLLCCCRWCNAHGLSKKRAGCCTLHSGPICAAHHTQHCIQAMQTSQGCLCTLPLPLFLALALWASSPCKFKALHPSTTLLPYFAPTLPLSSLERREGGREDKQEKEVGWRR